MLNPSLYHASVLMQVLLWSNWPICTRDWVKFALMILCSAVGEACVCTCPKADHEFDSCLRRPLLSSQQLGIMPQVALEIQPAQRQSINWPSAVSQPQY